MGTRFRWILFFFFALLFAASGTALLMVAQGYRYHFAKQRIEKTGEIFVDSKPKGARVFIDELITEKSVETPARIPGLHSGQYTIRVSKDGFFPWMRTVTVSPGLTALVRDVNLVRSDSVASVARESASRFIGTLASSRFAIITETDVIEVDRVSGQRRLLLRTSEEIRDTVPNPGGEGFFIATHTDIWAFDSLGRSTHMRLGDMPPAAVRWSADGSMLTARTGRGFALITDTAPPAFVLKGGVRDAVSDRGRIAAVFEKNPSQLAFYSLRGLRAVSDGLVTTARPIRHIRAVERDLIIVDYGQTTLGIIDIANKRQKSIVEHSGEQAFFLNSDELVTWNEFELYKTTLHNDGSYTRELLARQSVPLKAVRVLSKIGYLVALSGDGSLRLIELSQSGTQNRYTIVESGGHVKDMITVRSRDLLILREEGKDAVVETVQLTTQ